MRKIIINNYDRTSIFFRVYKNVEQPESFTNPGTYKLSMNL